jgi:hypothetical protein
MGTKDEVSHLRKIAIARLRYMYPSDLGEFQSRFSNSQEKLGLGLPFTIAAVSLARSCNVPSILPLCFLPNAWVNVSNTLAKRALRTGDIYTADDGTVYTVSPKDSELCLIGAWKVEERRREVFYNAFTERPDCRDLGCVRDHLHKMSAHPRVMNIAALPAISIFDAGCLRNSKLCVQCSSEIEPVWNEEIRATWQALPSFFDLPSWEDLLAIE